MPWVKGTGAEDPQANDENLIYRGIVKGENRSISIHIDYRDPISEEEKINIWLRQAEGDDGGLIDELTISINQSKQTRTVALDLIREWIKPNVSKEDLDRFLEDRKGE